jgi:hypothetical protein
MRSFSNFRLFAMGVLASQALMAQIPGGMFRGEVHDSSDAAVPRAKILIRSSEQGPAVLLESNGEGLYNTPTLVPGSYYLTARKDGFRAVEFGPVTLQVSQIVRVDFVLPVGVSTTSIQVEASGSQLLSPESADLSQVIVSEQVAQIPLNGRDWQQLITLSPGVTPGAPGESGSPNAVNIEGQRSKSNLYLVDGISTTSSAQGRGNSFNIPLEAVREFSVQAGAYSAEFADVAGGVINLQSKSGTNQWHGSAFEFFRNDKLDAADYFSNATGQPKNPLRYNQFGGGTGGPIRHDKTFVFADYQGTITHSGTPMLTSLPTGPERTGDFSALTVPIYNPFGASLARTPFTGNVIPPSLIDAAAANITKLLPQPNQFGANGQPLPFNNYAVTPDATANFEAFDIRVDHRFSAGSTLFARESFQDTNAVAPSIFGNPLGGSILGAGPETARNQNAGVGHSWQIGPTLINEVRVGLNRETTALTQADNGQNLAQQLGIPGVNLSPQTSGLPAIAVAGLFNVGGSLLTPLTLAATSWNVSEKISWVKGRHILRFGFDYQHELGSTGYLVYGRGFYTYLNLTTSSLVGTAGGNAYASFLTGAPYQVLRDEFPPGLVGLISHRYGFYAQDDFRITPRLTLNIGARYDIMPYPSEMHNRLSNFDPATGTMLLAGVNTRSNLVATDMHDIAPRIGLAWAPGNGSLSGNSSMVIRAGYGIGYVDPLGGEGALNSNEFNLPFYYLNNITQFPFTAQTYTIGKGLPPLVIPSPSAPSGNQRYIDPTERNPYSQTWSLGIQRAFGKSLMAEVSYVGTSGVGLLTADNINAALPGTTNPVTRQPYGPALGEIRELSDSAHSIYHGLQSKLEKRFSSGLYFLASYTWSKAIDDQSNGTDTAVASGQYPQDPYNAGLDRGLSSFDLAQRFVGSFVWKLPFGRGRAIGAALPGAVNALVGGWQLSGVFVAQSGSPFSVLMNCADINAQGNNCRPNRIASGDLPAGQQSISEWFNTAAFAIPSPQAYGNAGRNILFGPGMQNFDLGVSRVFPWGHSETRRLQVRAEFFNALNHTNFSLPVNSIDSPGFGSIISAAPGREIQLGARVEF